MGLSWRGHFPGAGAVPGDQTVEIVAVRAISAESLLVKQAFDAASGANLVGVALGPDWPAHLAMPAAAKQKQTGTRQSRRQQPKRPKPTRLLLFLTHHTTAHRSVLRESI